MSEALFKELRNKYRSIALEIDSDRCVITIEKGDLIIDISVFESYDGSVILDISGKKGTITTRRYKGQFDTNEVLKEVERAIEWLVA